MTKQIQNQIEKINMSRKATVYTLLAVLTCTFGMYCFFIASSINNVVTREKVQAESGNLNAQIATTENDYMGMKNNIDLALANEKGFYDATKVVYISRKTLSKALSMNNEI